MRLEEVTGIGPKTADLFKKLNIETSEDLVKFYPYKYEVLRKSDIKSIENGSKIIIDGIIEGQPMIVYLNKNLKKIIFRINTGTYILNVSIYNQTYLFEDLKYGKEITVIGKFDKIKNTVVATEIRFESLPKTPKIEAIYHTTNGLKSKTIAKFISSVLRSNFEVNSMVPDYICNKYKFDSSKWAINQIHNPTDVLSLKKAKQRLKYEELFSYLLKRSYIKKKIKDNEFAISRNIDMVKIDKFIKNIPFDLTEDQITCYKEILDDMVSKRCMNRLLQGDVGSGKTIVALISVYANFLSGYQSALMVPTEILARQHYDDACRIFSSYGINIELLTSSLTKSRKKEILRDLESGKIDFIIGTQALIQDGVNFDNLGLVITDEQHRFGVNQRNDLKDKAISPDVLSMSATPIPRTYALTIYGDMDVSSIKTKPSNRKEVITYFKLEKDITEVLGMMKIELDKGHQVYVIAPSINNEESSEIESVIKMEKKMNSAFSKLYKVGSIHGKMDTKEKNKVMDEFIDNKINILISTTVIEVGVNVKNASMIVVFNANMFGLSTLHQLRGRVGRSDIQSYCILVAKDSYKRLEMLERCNDGFAISEYDFQNRGEGDIFGSRQSGLMDFKLANVNRDFKMMCKAKEDADEFIELLLNNDVNKYDQVLNELEKYKNF